MKGIPYKYLVSLYPKAYVIVGFLDIFQCASTVDCRLIAIYWRLRGDSWWFFMVFVIRRDLTVQVQFTV